MSDTRIGAHHLVIKSDKVYPDSGPTIDGLPLDSCTSLTLNVTSGNVNTATIALDWLTYEVDGEYVIKVDDATRAALVALGWTPPSEA